MDKQLKESSFLTNFGIFTIKIYGDRCLRAKNLAVNEFGDSWKAFSEHFARLMHDSGGCGIAAPQVGINRRFCLIDVGLEAEHFSFAEQDGKNLLENGKLPPSFFPLMLLNPEIISASEVSESRIEGCLSLEDVRGHVTRPEAVSVSYQDIHGQGHLLQTNGFFARCIQHEIDHLNGILFVDRISTREKSRVQVQLKQLKRRH